MSENLKPCPFCNGEAHTQYTRSNGRWYVVCGNCHVSTTDYLDSDDAIKAWNRRLTMETEVLLQAAKEIKEICDNADGCDECPFRIMLADSVLCASFRIGEGIKVNLRTGT